MTIQKKPYLIIPFLIEQPTWGGEYICTMKGWLHKSGLEGKKIGQSYELYSKSMLATSIISSDDPLFGPHVQDCVPTSTFIEERAFPLIKFTQAKGNSFQLHVKPEQNEKDWRPKAESWYYFEGGKITFGLKSGADIDKYKQTCLAIDQKMKEVSALVVDKKMSVDVARKIATDFILQQNPWQFVNVHEVQKGDVVDLSGGGLHHSWEEDEINHPLGNIVYEVQQDVMDPVSTIRSFDQGKIKDDGTIREIQIDTYFKSLDSDEKRNTLITKKNENGVLFDTPYYSLSLLSINNEITMESTTSFHHLFVQKGKIQVKDIKENIITVGRGHSCFIPQGVQYTINSTGASDVLLTFLR